MQDNRQLIVQFLMILVALVFLSKLFYIQIVDSSYKEEANNNVLQRVIEYPYRGVITDRNGNLLVANSGVYDLMLIPKKLRINGDLKTLCELLEITPEEFDEKLRLAKKYSSVKPSVFMEQMSMIKFARIQDRLADFPGLYIQARTVRNYPNATAANALGYIGEISKEKIELVGKNNYRSGDFIGISGIESFYEEQLRGTRGVKYTLVNVRGVEKGRFKNGAFDTLSIPGLDLVSGIDMKLQKYAETLMVGKIGSVVAIEPSTGEILTFISNPTYDPNQLTGEDFPKNYKKLVRDSLKPLFNRALMAMYPPGSVFKTINGLYALQHHLLDTNTIIACNRRIINCHGKHNSANFRTSIQYSCNPYYWNVYKMILSQGYSTNMFKDARMCYDDWREHVLKFGLGDKTGIDLPNEKKGIIPSSKYYNKIYGENRWAFSTVYSNGIGQGEISVTPIQMANVAAILANRGWYYTPHLIKSIGGSGKPLPQFLEKKVIQIDTSYYRAIANGMSEVVRAGTGYLAKAKEYNACGKTGTVENPHGADHSVFIGYAPKDNPKIAVAVVVENSGFGAEWAAPIAGLMFAKYLKGTLTHNWVENYVKKRNFILNPAKKHVSH
jgi:penicillin-binding protein 2